MNELTITDPTFTALTTTVLFTSVEVKHGRKFRGFGYAMDSYEKSNGGFSGSGVRPLKYYEVVRVYIPATKGFDSYNEYKESEKVQVPEEQRQKDLLDYVNGSWPRPRNAAATTASGGPTISGRFSESPVTQLWPFSTSWTSRRNDNEKG